METYDLTQIPDSQFIDDEGIHTVAVREIKDCQSNSGTPGKTLILQDEHGRTMRHTLWVTAGSMPFTKMFARSCGLTEQEMRVFNYNMLLNKTLQIVTEADGSYQKVVKTELADTKIDTNLLPPVPEPTKKPTEDVPF